MVIAGQIKKKKKAEKLSCDGCSDCCLYVAVEIDKPTCKGDYSHLFWHLHHENVAIYIGHDRSWNLEFMTRCKNLSPDGRCLNYEDRPLICSSYSLDNCTTHSPGKYYRHRFSTADELKMYLRRKGIDFQFKRRT